MPRAQQLPVDINAVTHPCSLSPDASSREEALHHAFALFSDLSEQLTASYRTLEARVATLNAELSEVSYQRRQELDEKQKLAARLENLISFLPGGVVVLDSSGVIGECNPAALDLLGEPLEGELWRDVIARSFAPKQDDGHEVSLVDGRRISLATRNLGIDGQIILLTDQTETRRLQSELSRHERLSALGKMVSALAHQIRTPLSTAMLYAGHLANPALDSDKREKFTVKMTNRLRHMERQVQDMLLFVKGELPLDDLITVADLQRELAEAMEMPLATASAQCEWQLDNPVRGSLRCNRDALVSALLNLVENALQASGSGAVVVITLAIVEREHQPLLAISIVDTGAGMSADMLAHARDLFVTSKSQGTGLGLAVVDAVARAHKGFFTLQSTEGQGTCAGLLLPLVD
ncbi:MAG TPA: ATP-binding protein [Cellvibrionaceae bacterium]